MTAPIVIIGAPSSIGIKPYDDGRTRRLDLAPDVLRQQRLVTRVRAIDLGDLVPGPYRDYVRPPGGTRNEREVAAYSREIAGRVASASSDGSFVVVLGGDCSIVLGCLLGVRQAGRAPVGLVYIDAHGDFATTAESRTGSAASMCLALAVGRGDSSLARLAGTEPLARPRDVVLIGRRDDDEPWYGQDAMRELPILDIPDAAVRTLGLDETIASTLARVTQPELGGFWIHLDADVIDPDVVPAVDSPTPGGFDLDALASFLTPLVRHPKALGLELTIYDPELDPDRTSAARLASLLERVLTDSRRAAA